MPEVDIPVKLEEAERFYSAWMDAENETVAADLAADAFDFFQPMIAELRALRARVAELESSETKLIAERDDAEDALSDAYNAVFNKGPVLEWTSAFHYADAVKAIADESQFRIKQIAELTTPRPMAEAPRDMTAIAAFHANGNRRIVRWLESWEGWNQLGTGHYFQDQDFACFLPIPHLPPTGDAK